MTSKIRISMDKMSLTVDVGENANYLFLKIANELLCNAFGKENTESIINKIDAVKRAPAPKMKPIVKEDIESDEKADTEPDGKTEIEPEDQIKYKGFIYWKCADCGHVRGFCLKKESCAISIASTAKLDGTVTVGMTKSFQVLRTCAKLLKTRLRNFKNSSP